MDKRVILEYLRCPLTKLIFNDPVLALDGNVYEYLAIQAWMQRNQMSPTTNEKMGSSLMRAGFMKKMVDDFLTKYPEYKTDQFLFKKPFYLFVKECVDLLKQKQFEKLKYFTEYMLNYDINDGKETLIEVVCRSECPTDVLKYIIDSSLDYDMEDKRKLRPSHIICKYANEDVIRHLLTKKIDLEASDNTGNRLISYLIIYKKDISLINEVLEKHVDINYENYQGAKLIHYIISNGWLELLKLFIKFGCDYKSPSVKFGNLNPLQYAFRYCPSVETIQYLIDQESMVSIDEDPINANEQLIYQNDKLSKKDKQSMVLCYLTKLFKKPELIENFMEGMNKKK